jgi:transposase InsO family protein
VRVAVTAHPTAEWTLRQLREVIGLDDDYRYLLHDRDSIFARSMDGSIRNLGLTVLRSPPRSPKANAICERVIGTIRRECLNRLIPLSEPHLRSILRTWVGHYNRARPRDRVIAEHNRLRIGFGRDVVAAWRFIPGTWLTPCVRVV